MIQNLQQLETFELVFIWDTVCFDYTNKPKAMPKREMQHKPQLKYPQIFPLQL